VPKQHGALISEALAEVSTAQAALVESLVKQWRSTAQLKMGQFGRPEFYSGWIRGLDGRPIFIEHEHTVLVFMLQSDEAIMMQLALVLLHNRLTELGWEWGKDFAFVANIHDEYQCEVREDLVQQYVKISNRAIVKASELLKCSVLAQGDSAVGSNWYETH
jgi:DNA polymerase-1